MTMLLKLAAAASSLVLLGLSVYPGVLPDLLFIVVFLSPLWLPAPMIGGIMFLVVRSRSTKKPSISPDIDLIGDEVGGGKETLHPKRRITTAPAIITVSLILLWFGTPRRIAFFLSRPAFERLLVTAPANRYEGEPLGRRLGIYEVDRWATDPRGGVYFRIIGNLVLFLGVLIFHPKLLVSLIAPINPSGASGAVGVVIAGVGSVLAAALVAWNFFHFALAIPIEITIDEVGTVGFRSRMRMVTIPAGAIRSITTGAWYDPDRFQAVVRHEGGKLTLVNQFADFRDFLSTLRELNPSIEIKGF